LKRNISVGAYGWRHSHWSGTFYPEDLPVSAEEDWRLTYYSNEFNCVLVPADYWLCLSDQDDAIDCEHWLDEVNDEFQFYVECSMDIFDHVSFGAWSEQLKLLQPQLSALVITENQRKIPESKLKQLRNLAERLRVTVFINGDFDSQIKQIWRKDRQCSSALALLEDDLTDLRSVRATMDDFVSQKSDIDQISSKATIIVNSPRLQANDLAQFRKVIEVMGY
jgi:enamine deaminase RidA (YjgF/YER057c/UK114 family)